MWLGPPSHPALDVDEMEVEDQQRRQGGADSNLPWNARERTLIKTMGSYLKKSEKMPVGFSELEYFLLSLGEEAVGIIFVAMSARKEWGHSSQ